MIEDGFEPLEITGKTEPIWKDKKENQAERGRTMFDIEKHKAIYGLFIQMADDGIIPKPDFKVETEEVQVHRFWHRAFEDFSREDFDMLEETFFDAGDKIGKLPYDLYSRYNKEQPLVTAGKMRVFSKAAHKTADGLNRSIEFITEITGGEGFPEKSAETLKEFRKDLERFDDMLSGIKTAKQARVIAPKCHEQMTDLIDRLNTDISPLYSQFITGLACIQIMNGGFNDKPLFIEIDNELEDPIKDDEDYPSVMRALTEEKFLEHIPKDTSVVIVSKSSDNVYLIGTPLPSMNVIAPDGTDTEGGKLVMALKGSIAESFYLFMANCDFDGEKRLAFVCDNNKRRKWTQAGMDDYFLSAIRKAFPLLKGEKTENARFITADEMMADYCEDRDFITVKRPVVKTLPDKDEIDL